MHGKGPLPGKPCNILYYRGWAGKGGRGPMKKLREGKKNFYKLYYLSKI